MLLLTISLNTYHLPQHAFALGRTLLTETLFSLLKSIIAKFNKKKLVTEVCIKILMIR